MSGSRPPHWMRSLTGAEPVPQQLADLNEAVIMGGDEPSVSIATVRSGGHKSDVSVDVIFTELESRLVAEIERSDAVIGCMAWLTNERVLAALAQRRFVQILVQKEDFLRPDGSSWSRNKLHQLYAALPASSRFIGGIGQRGYSTSTDDTLGPVRCIGTCGPRGPAIPRMHHKFMVLCDFVELDYGHTIGGPWQETGIIPRRVWTGSFNATWNGTRSLENAVVLHDPEVARLYADEWGTLLGLSEPLDWSSEWIMPEYRIGT